MMKRYIMPYTWSPFPVPMQEKNFARWSFLNAEQNFLVGEQREGMVFAWLVHVDDVAMQIRNIRLSPFAIDAATGSMTRQVQL